MKSKISYHSLDMKTWLSSWNYQLCCINHVGEQYTSIVLPLSTIHICTCIQKQLMYIFLKSSFMFMLFAMQTVPNDTWWQKQSHIDDMYLFVMLMLVDDVDVWCWCFYLSGLCIYIYIYTLVLNTPWITSYNWQSCSSHSLQVNCTMSFTQ